MQMLNIDRGLYLSRTGLDLVRREHYGELGEKGGIIIG